MGIVILNVLFIALIFGFAVVILIKTRKNIKQLEKLNEQMKDLEVLINQINKQENFIG